MRAPTGCIDSTVMSVDKAGTEGGDGAFTAIVIMHKMKHLGGKTSRLAILHGRPQLCDMREYWPLDLKARSGPALPR
jgi:hypothetical protein